MTGRHLPPNDQVIGRTDVSRILGCSKSTTWRMQERGEFGEVLVVKGVSWFDRAKVLQLALEKKNEQETTARRPASGIPSAIPRGLEDADGRRRDGPPPARKGAPERDPLPTRAKKRLDPVPDSWLAEKFVPLDEPPSDAKEDSSSPPDQKKKMTEVPAEWLAEDFKTLDELEEEDDGDDEP